jgi:TonB family protein
MHPIAILYLITFCAALESCAARQGPASPAQVPAGEAIADSLVEDPPRGLVQTAPQYPAELRIARIEGRVTFQFVLDTAGVPQIETFRIVSSPHEGLSEAVRAVLPSWRYTPARVGGRKVRVRLEQWVNFSAR